MVSSSFWQVTVVIVEIGFERVVASPTGTVKWCKVRRTRQWARDEEAKKCLIAIVILKYESTLGKSMLKAVFSKINLTQCFSNLDHDPDKKYILHCKSVPKYVCDYNWNTIFTKQCFCYMQCIHYFFRLLKNFGYNPVNWFYNVWFKNC